MIGQGVVIRASRRRDWRSLRSLFNAHFPVELTLPRLDRELWSLFPDIIVAEIAGQVVGAAWLRHGLVPGLCWLDFIAVHPAMRQRGIGTRLLFACEERATERGESRMGLAVRRENEVALRLYERIGFRVVTENDLEFRLQREIKSIPLPPRPRRERGKIRRGIDLILYRVATFVG